MCLFGLACLATSRRPIRSPRHDGNWQICWQFGASCSKSRTNCASSFPKISSGIGLVAEPTAGCAQAVLDYIASDATPQRRASIIESVPGMGAINAASSCADMPELGMIYHRQAGCLLGVAPFGRDSGQHCGRRRIRGSRAKACHGRYMAGLSAIRWAPGLKATYARLVQLGKPHKVVLVNVMRKLISLRIARCEGDQPKLLASRSMAGPAPAACYRDGGGARGTRQRPRAIPRSWESGPQRLERSPAGASSACREAVANQRLDGRPPVTSMPWYVDLGDAHAIPGHFQSECKRRLLAPAPGRHLLGNGVDGLGGCLRNRARWQLTA